MKKFLQVVPPEEYRAFARGLSPLGRETVDLADALGRVLAEQIVAEEDLPAFRRSIMDGFAVHSADTIGASASSPAYLRVVGEVLIGQPADHDIGAGECSRIPTGGALPAAADAVIMLEYTREIPGGLVEAAGTVSPGENVVAVGEDVGRGQHVLAPGKVLRPQEVGILAGLGRTFVQVFRRVRVAIISTGDELVEPSAAPGPAQVRNVNQFSLGAHVTACGGEARLLGIAPDNPARIEEKIRQGLAEADLVLVSGGSSVGTRDLTAAIIDGLGEPGVVFHGVAVRPGKPTILGQVGQKLVFGLPGHPIAAMVSFLNFVRPTLMALGGTIEATDRPVMARLSDNVHSKPGREDYVQVRLSQEPGGKYQAHPLFKKSGMVTSMTAADGYLIVPGAAEGLEAGEEVAVHLYPQVLR